MQYSSHVPKLLSNLTKWFYKYSALVYRRMSSSLFRNKKKLHNLGGYFGATYKQQHLLTLPKLTFPLFRASYSVYGQSPLAIVSLLSYLRTYLVIYLIILSSTAFSPICPTFLLSKRPLFPASTLYKYVLLFLSRTNRIRSISCSGSKFTIFAPNYLMPGVEYRCDTNLFTLQDPTTRRISRLELHVIPIN